MQTKSVRFNGIETNGGERGRKRERRSDMQNGIKGFNSKFVIPNDIGMIMDIGWYQHCVCVCRVHKDQFKSIHIEHTYTNSQYIRHIYIELEIDDKFSTFCSANQLQQFQ